MEKIGKPNKTEMNYIYILYSLCIENIHNIFNNESLFEFILLLLYKFLFLMDEKRLNASLHRTGLTIKKALRLNKSK